MLHLLNVDHKSSGEVKCCVICPNNPIIFNVYHTSLTVLPLPISDRFEPVESFVESCSNKSSFVHDLTAYITKRPDDQTVLVGDSIQLDVEYCGVPEPTVRWMRAVSIEQNIWKGNWRASSVGLKTSLLHSLKLWSLQLITFEYWIKLITFIRIFTLKPLNQKKSFNWLRQKSPTCTKMQIQFPSKKLVLVKRFCVCQLNNVCSFNCFFLTQLVN